MRMPNLLALELPPIVDRCGRAIVLASCDSYQWKLDHWSLRTAIIAKKGDEEIIIPVPNIRKFYTTATILAEQASQRAIASLRMYHPDLDISEPEQSQSPEQTQEASEEEHPSDEPEPDLPHNQNPLT